MRNKKRYILTFGIVVTVFRSWSSHSTFGAGLPRAEQSARRPAEFVNSNLCDGSIINAGPCVSNEFAITIESIQLNN